MTRPSAGCVTRRQILRIRQYGSKWVLTHKSVPGGQSGEGRHKNRVETETEVADGPVLGKVFEALGFGPVFVYEKWRAEWADATGHCVLDETPLGVYAELEGPSEWIDATAKQLGISDSQFITLSYGRIFESWRDETGFKVENFTFDEIPERFRSSKPRGPGGQSGVARLLRSYPPWVYSLCRIR